MSWRLLSLLAYMCYGHSAAMALGVLVNIFALGVSPLVPGIFMIVGLLCGKAFKKLSDEAREKNYTNTEVQLPRKLQAGVDEGELTQEEYDKVIALADWTEHEQRS